MTSALICPSDLRNIGDLALLLQAVHGLRTLAGLGPVRVRTWGAIPPEVRRQLANRSIEPVPGKNLFRMVSAAADALVVFGGGQAFRNNESWASLSSLSVITSVANATGGGVVAIGCGAGALEGTRLPLWRHVLAGSKMLSVRDQTSLRNLRAALPAECVVQLSADVAFLPGPLHSELESRLPADSIVIAPGCDRAEGRETEPEALAKAALAACSSLGLDRVAVLAHDARPEMDRPLCEAVSAHLRSLSSRVEVTPVASHELSDYTTEYRRAALVVTNRLHSVIFGLLAKVPVFAIDDGAAKIGDACARFGVRLGSISDLSPSFLDEVRLENKLGPSLSRETAVALAKLQVTADFKQLQSLGRKTQQPLPRG